MWSYQNKKSYWAKKQDKSKSQEFQLFKHLAVLSGIRAKIHLSLFNNATSQQLNTMRDKKKSPQIQMKVKCDLNTSLLLFQWTNKKTKRLKRFSRLKSLTSRFQMCKDLHQVILSLTVKIRWNCRQINNLQKLQRQAKKRISMDQMMKTLKKHPISVQLKRFWPIYRG